MTRIESTFEITGWDETPYREADDGSKATRASVTRTFGGALRGDGAVEYLMAYGTDGTASYVGLERVEGTLGDRSGTFVLQHVGRFEEGAATGTVSVVPASGTGELAALTGEGAFAAEKGPSGTLTLDYELG